MAAPPFQVMPAMMPPPLPPGWTEHLAPGGQPYYHNAFTNESTYIRPLPNFPIGPSVPPQAPQPTVESKKKVKPVEKTPIPGTDWLRVKTNEGNTFYTNKAKKESVWTVPEEIKDAVENLEKEEAAAEAKKLEDEHRARESAEVERVKREVDEVIAKRKAEEPQPMDEIIVSKKARVEDAEEDEDEEDADESEEEEWQKEAAAQMAAEAEEDARRQEEEAKLAEEEAKKAEKELKKKAAAKGTAGINMPARVDLSIEEAKALFKTLLREKDINPLLPWDTALPQFVSDPRYVLLPSVAARREAFNEYCRDRARELRAAKVASQKAESADPKEEFERLLRDEVKSTRTVWSDWRKTWKKDRRFYGWGRDDREREKRFREWIKELGEQKRAAAQKAEADFIGLLKEKGGIKPDSIWKDVKRKLDKDPRYDPVGSSSLREEIFNTYVKTLMAVSSSLETATPAAPSSASKYSVEDEQDAAERSRKDRAVLAVKEREEKVRVQRQRAEVEMAKSRIGLVRGEGERDFRTLLTDAIRDPQATWDASLAQLKTDPRFTTSPLPINRQIRLFHDHIAQLRSKHTQTLHGLFASHAPSLATTFADLPLSSLLSSPPATKLGLNSRDLEAEFDRWQQERTQTARVAFDQMLGENAFVEFWGRLSKIGGEGVDGGVKMDEDDTEDGEGGGGKADLKTLAKSVDIKEMELVLKNDKRFTSFDHVPEQRERWLRDHLAHLAAPKLSVHIPDSV